MLRLIEHPRKLVLLLVGQGDRPERAEPLAGARLDLQPGAKGGLEVLAPLEQAPREPPRVPFREDDRRRECELDTRQRAPFPMTGTRSLTDRSRADKSSFARRPIRSRDQRVLPFRRRSASRPRAARCENP